MANELLEADAGALDAAGASFINCANDAENVITQIRSQVNNLTPTFQGSAAQAFYSKIETFLKQMEYLVEEVNTMGNDLKIVSGKVRQLQAEAQSSFNSIA